MNKPRNIREVKGKEFVVVREIQENGILKDANRSPSHAHLSYFFIYEDTKKEIPKHLSAKVGAIFPGP